MAIIKSLKEKGLDIYLNYHPKVLLLKKESKKLQKELKHQYISLMQCQTIVAKQHGFNDWHHFMAIIKKHYNSELDKQLFNITKDTSFNHNQFLFGKDINFNHYKWQDDSAMRTHQLILGEDLYNTYDLFLAKQAIYNNKEVFFLNASEKDIDLLISFSKKNGRENDIRIFDFTNNTKYNIYNCYLNHNINIFNLNSIKDFYTNCLHYNRDNYLWVDKAISLCNLIPIFDDNLKEDNISLNYKSLIDFLNLDNLIDFYHKKDLSDLSKNILLQYFKTLPLFDISLNKQLESTYEHHGFLHMQLIKLMSDLVYNPIFSNNGISIESLLFQKNNQKYINIFNFGNSNNDFIYQNFTLNILKNHVGHYLGKTDNLHFSNINSKKDTSFIFVRECYLSSNLGVFLAQARSSGISLNYSYSSREKLDELSFINSDIIFANTLTKILSISEKNKLFNLNYTNDSNTLNNQNIISNNINYFWLLKNTNLYQIHFDMNYLNFH